MKMNFKNDCKFKIILFFGALILSGTEFRPAAHALEIQVKEHVVVNGDTIYLGEIADFEPVNDSRIAHLRGIAIASAPSPGNAFRLNRRFLNYKVGSAIMGKTSIDLNLPESLEVKRSAQYINADRLEKIFKDHILNHSIWSAEKIRFEKIRTSGTIALPQGDLEWNVIEKGNHSYVGNISLSVVFFVNGDKIRKLTLSGKVKVIREVVMTKRRIKRGQLISREDLTFAKEERHLQKEALTEIEEAIGKRAVRNVKADQVITSGMVEEPPLVKKGNRVIISAENENIKITTSGKVMEDGRTGDMIKVINIRSGKEILATVKGPGLLTVHF